MVSIRKVAEHAGVSLGTVSNVLNNPEKVTDKTRKRVLEAIQELGFVRNASAHQLGGGQSKFIGLVVLDITNPFFSEVARGAENAASESDLVLILGNLDNSPEKMDHYLRVFEEQRVQGLLVTPSEIDLAPLLRLKESGIALVLLGPVHKGVCTVVVDDVYGGELGASHLFDYGHIRIAFVHGPLSLRPCVERQRGVHRAVRERGWDLDRTILDITTKAQNVREGELCVEQLLTSPDRPTAVFCANDLLALGVMRGLNKRGLRIPEDMALVGYDDIDFAEVLSPALTSIRQPKYELGRAATELLLEEVRHPAKHKHRQIIYQPELIVRESSGQPRH